VSHGTTAAAGTPQHRGPPGASALTWPGPGTSAATPHRQRLVQTRAPAAVLPCRAIATQQQCHAFALQPTCGSNSSMDDVHVQQLDDPVLETETSLVGACPLTTASCISQGLPTEGSLGGRYCTTEKVEDISLCRSGCCRVTSVT